MNIGDIIYNKRKEHGLTLEQVGNAVGVSKSTVKKWETGYIANIKRDKIAKLADVLQISPVVLINGDMCDKIESNATILPENVYMIPLYESVSAGFGAYANDCVIDYIPLPLASEIEANETLCIKVSGDSMYPKIEDGDKIVVRKQSSVDSGSVGVFLIDNEDSVVKKVFYAPGEDWLELHSFNPEYKTRRFEGSDVERVQVLGLVKNVIKDI